MTTSSADLDWIANYIWGIADHVMRELHIHRAAPKIPSQSSLNPGLATSMLKGALLKHLDPPGGVGNGTYTAVDRPQYCSGTGQVAPWPTAPPL